MSDPLSGLKIEHWWHAFTVVGGAGSIASIAIKIDFISQRDCFLLFLGMFLFGVGQWINHPMRQRIVPGFKITGYHRESSAMGIILEVLGCVIFAVEIYRVLLSK